MQETSRRVRGGESDPYAVFVVASVIFPWDLLAEVCLWNYPFNLFISIISVPVVMQAK
jgi:hypothetical protein